MGYMAGAATVSMVALADQLGIFKFMAGWPAESTQQVADGMRLSERWVRELLHQLVRPRPRCLIACTDRVALAQRAWITCPTRYHIIMAALPKMHLRLLRRPARAS